MSKKKANMKKIKDEELKKIKGGKLDVENLSSTLSLEHLNVMEGAFVNIKDSGGSSAADRQIATHNRFMLGVMQHALTTGDATDFNILLQNGAISHVDANIERGFFADYDHSNPNSIDENLPRQHQNLHELEKKFYSDPVYREVLSSIPDLTLGLSIDEYRDKLSDS
jgi:hypothetical protein